MLHLIQRSVMRFNLCNYTVTDIDGRQDYDFLTTKAPQSQGTLSTLVQVIVCCLAASSH